MAASPGAGASNSLGCDDFAGLWRLERITDGRRSKTDLDESIRFRCEGDALELEYRIADRFGSRTLDLRAPLDGTPLEQRVQSGSARVSARLEGQELVLSIEREAPFGHIHNRRRMALDSHQGRLDAYRENFRKDGKTDSGWHETWVRVD